MLRPRASAVAARAMTAGGTLDEAPGDVNAAAVLTEEPTPARFGFLLGPRVRAALAQPLVGSPCGETDQRAHAQGGGHVLGRSCVPALRRHRWGGTPHLEVIVPSPR